MHGGEIWSGRRLRGRHWLRRRDVRVVASNLSAGALARTYRATVVPSGIAPDWYTTLVNAGPRDRAPGDLTPTRELHLMTAFRLNSWQTKGWVPSSNRPLWCVGRPRPTAGGSRANGWRCRRCWTSCRLNAEPELRRAALRALAARLRDGSSVLIVNNHGNLWSHKALLCPVHTIRGGGRPRTSGNYLIPRQVNALMAEAGLRAERVHGCGLIGGRLAGRMPADRLLRWELGLTRAGLGRWGVNQIYLARLA